MKKVKFILFSTYLLLSFRTIENPKIAELQAAQVFIELLPNGQFTEAAAVFDNLAKKTQSVDYQQAANYIRSHSTRESFDFAFFYRQILPFRKSETDPSVSVFDWAFSEKKKDVENGNLNENGNENGNENLNKKRAELGHLLFYDPILSANNKRSCASCHRPEKAFSDQRTTSRAFAFAENLDKNAPSLINATQQTRFFHEGNHRELRQVFEAVITNAKEFNNSYENITARLNGSDAYLALLKTAFPDKKTFTRAEVDESLTQFLKILRGYDSPFDRFMNNPKATIDPLIVNGFNLFLGKAQCGTCHRMPSFGGSHLPFSEGHDFQDFGDKQLKTPSLRNASLTFPYLFQGILPDLSAIFDEPFHLKKLSEKHIVLLHNEKQNILIFLNALNDAPKLQANEPNALPFVKDFDARTIGGKY